MYAGRIVEQGSVERRARRPLHPYTHGLIGSVPSRNRRGAPLAQIPGMTPVAARPAAGLRLPHPLPARRRGRVTASRSRDRSRVPGRTSVRLLLSDAGRSRVHDDAPLVDCARHRSASAHKRFVQPLDLAGRSRARPRRRMPTRSCTRSTTCPPSPRGEVVGLVGESGCGKSTLGRMVAGICSSRATAMCCSRARTGRQSPAPRRRDARLAVQMIFQDPFASLNPRMRVADIVGEAPVRARHRRRAELDAYLDDAAARVGLDPASSPAIRTSSPAGSAAASASRARSR